MARKQKRERDTKRTAEWGRKEAQIRRLVRDDRFELSDHVYDKIETNYWHYDDVVHSLLSGFICKVEEDELKDAIDGKKYTIQGHDCSGTLIQTVGKIVRADDGAEYFVITAF